MTSDTYPSEQRRLDTELMMRYDAGKKSAWLAYAIWLVPALTSWFFIPTFGLHRLYLGRWTSGLLALGLQAVSLLLSFVLIGFLGFLIIIPWWLVDALLIPGMTRDHNNRLIERLRR